MLLHGARNSMFSDNILVQDGIRELRRRLPPGWMLSERIPQGSLTDAIAELTAPDGRTGVLVLEAKVRLDPKRVSDVLETTRDSRMLGTVVIVARYLSEATRARLREGDTGYLDLTGNVRIVVPDPGLFIETQGAPVDPDREQRPARSLRGVKAGRIVRALIDHKEPPGVRELATLTKIDPGYVSRVLAYLDTEALITRVGRGRMQSVDWPALLRRWAEAAPLESRGQVRTYLEPRGLSTLIARLGKSDERHAVTGSLAAAALAPIASARLGVVWIRDAAHAAARLGLRPAEAGANVLLIEPGDEGVFVGAVQRDGVWYAAPSQVAADLLTSPGRGPAEAEELIGWMRANEDQWRQ
jgi:hypothetical protein